MEVLMAADRRADVTWTGSLAAGEGLIEFFSGATGNLPVTWASRTERSDGKTSPEELIAAAHASCFAMALSHGLTEAGHKVERLHISATATIDQVEGAFKITKVALNVSGKVSGLSDAAFRAAAEDAKNGCPVSQALKGNVAITLAARLEQ
jgi:osmotically inducible protein OsmC